MAIQTSPTLVDVVRRRAMAEPSSKAITFLEDGEGLESPMTWMELDHRATAVASLLSAATQPGDRILLLFPPGLDYIVAFFGCLYARRIAVPAYPPDPRRFASTIQRLGGILQDARPAAVLTSSAIASAVPGMVAELPGFADMRWLPIDDLASVDLIQSAPARDEVALLQYTSGSTGQPKGVILSHANLAENCERIRRRMRLTPESSFVSWLPPYHDMGLIGSILVPAYVGFPTTLMSPLAFLSRPARWLQAVSRYRATISGAPNFAYDLCVRRVDEETRLGLDLSPWVVAFNGSEPVRPETLEAFSSAFEPSGFRPSAWYPAYGMAETTLMATGPEPLTQAAVVMVDAETLGQRQVRFVSANAPRATKLVGCGAAVDDHRIAIVEPETGLEVPAGQVGEILVSGPSVSAGYWGKPGDETFGARLGSAGDTDFVRSGDLGFIESGVLFVTGRIKDLIKVRGRSFYPTDIERAAERADPRVRPGCSAAFSVSDAERDEHLVIAAEVEDGLVESAEQDEMVRAIRGQVALDIGLQVQWLVLLEPRRIPKTSSGKVQRSRCRSLLLSGALDGIVASWRIDASW